MTERPKNRIKVTEASLGHKDKATQWGLRRENGRRGEREAELKLGAKTKILLKDGREKKSPAGKTAGIILTESMGERG